MKTSPAGIQAIRLREGFRTVGYLDSRGIATNGVGHAVTGGPPPVWVGQGWTIQQVDEVLAADLVKFEDEVNRDIERPMTQNAFDACVSLAFNIGAGGFRGSSVRRCINRGDMAGAADAFLMWDHPSELIGRRKGERAQFLRPDDPDNVHPVAPIEIHTDMKIDEIQTALNRHGADPQIDVDGDIGSQTLSAVKAFQTSHGLVADGIIGPKTLAALALPPSSSGRPA